MLHWIKINNFFSFANETTLSMCGFNNKNECLNSYLDSVTGEKVSRVTAVLGANASGKTNILKPLGFFRWFTAKSFNDNDSSALFHPHFFYKEKESNIEICFEQNNSIYQYKAVFQNNALKSEILKKPSQTKPITLFEVIYNDNNSFDTFNIKNLNIEHSYSNDVKAILMRKTNVSILSAVRPFNLPTLGDVDEFIGNIRSNANLFGKMPTLDTKTFNFLNENKNYFASVVKFIKENDTGVDDIEMIKLPSTNDKGENTEIFIPYASHKKSSKINAKLPIWLESNGTLSLFSLLAKVYPILETGGLFVFDELDSDLHPLLFEKVVELFLNKETNPKGAQIIFTCHSPHIMSVLDKGQIYLVEKNDHISEGWRLDEMKVRNDGNYYAKYMAGAYGAIPNL